MGRDLKTEIMPVVDDISYTKSFFFIKRIFSWTSYQSMSKRQFQHAFCIIRYLI